jgi:hypothetical protein
MEKKIGFIKKSIYVHGERYNYSLVEYINSKTKVKIICPEHGEFEQSPEKHIGRKQGCPICAGTKKITQIDFILKSKEIHGDKYNYSLCNYVNANTNVILICPEHGEFKQLAKLHMSGSNCPMCYGRNKNNKDIINELTKIHDGKYDYSFVDYKSEKGLIKIICPEHGLFEQTYNTHKKGHGCPRCVGRNKTLIDFIKEVKLIHGDKYDYSLVNYNKSNDKIKIICPIHGDFEQNANNHLNGNGCPKCKGLTISDKKTKTTSEFINEAKLIHNDKYDYSLVNYIGCKDYIEIKCNEHGIFKQWPDSHLQGTGCPKCGLSYDKSENEVKDFIKLLNINTIENSRKIISPLELDIFIPSHNIAIEFNGLYWHSELYKPSNYHLNKTELCEKQGIQLIHIFEDEWLFKQDIVKSRLMNILGLTPNKIYGRKTIIKEVSPKESKEFLNNNHLQGSTNASIKLGLYYNNELVSVMLFNKPRLGIGVTYDGYELSRFCNKLNTSVIGGADKLLKYFIKTYQPKQILSYADIRWSQGDLYQKLGFKETHINKPNYWYIINNDRKHRFSFRKHILNKNGFDIKNKTEHEIMLERKIYRIYDCGTITYKKTLS